MLGTRRGERSTVHEIADAHDWNRIVVSFPACDFRQGFEWAALRSQLGWKPLRLAVHDGGRWVAAATILVRQVPGAGALLYAPRGPLVLPSAPEALGPLVEEVRRRARTVGGIVLRISPSTVLPDAAALAPLHRYGFVPIEDEFTTWNTPRCSHVLDVARDEDGLWRAIRRRVREYVTAAARKGLVIEATEREQDLVDFYPLLVTLSEVKGLPIRRLQFFTALFRRYQQSGALTLLVVRVRGRIGGGLLAVRLGGRSSMLYTSVRSEIGDAVKHHLAPALYWEYIRRAHAEGCESVDFGSSGVHLVPRPTDAGWGVYRFKAGFGGRYEVYAPFHDLVLRPAAYTLFRMCERRGLPMLWRVMARTNAMARRVRSAA